MLSGLGSETQITCYIRQPPGGFLSSTSAMEMATDGGRHILNFL
jgi:hypothetical protein